MRIIAAIILGLAGGSACVAAVTTLLAIDEPAIAPGRQALAPVTGPDPAAAPSSPVRVIPAPVREIAATRASGDVERLAGFAAPSLAAVSPASLGTLLASAPTAGTSLPTFVAPGRLLPEGIAPNARGTAVAGKSPVVPPMARRKPKEPAPEPTELLPVEGQPPESAPVSVAGGSSAPDTTGRQAKRVPFDTTTRSALGGPKPAPASTR